MSNDKRSSHTCRAIIVSCMDFRIQNHLHNWTLKNIKGDTDRLTIAGGVKNLPFVLKQIGLSYKLHHICEVYLINHEDCGAYGKEGNFQRHKEDLLHAKKTLKEKIPSLKITTFYLKLNGEIKQVTE